MHSARGRSDLMPIPVNDVRTGECFTGRSDLSRGCQVRPGTRDPTVGVVFSAGRTNDGHVGDHRLPGECPPQRRRITVDPITNANATRLNADGSGTRVGPGVVALATK